MTKPYQLFSDPRRIVRDARASDAAQKRSLVSALLRPPTETVAPNPDRRALAREVAEEVLSRLQPDPGDEPGEQAEEEPQPPRPSGFDPGARGESAPPRRPTGAEILRAALMEARSRNTIDYDDPGWHPVQNRG